MRPGDVIADRFEIERLAGQGGMGAVYRARDRADAGHVAIKVLYGNYVAELDHAERFAREARLLAELQHPRIVKYVAHGTTEAAVPWLALEWLDGESLSDRLRRKGLTVGETVAVGLGMAEALAVAHARGVVHRDVKPSNLFLEGRSPNGLKVLDFGVARLAGSQPLTLTGAVVGTPFYMAPEQARGERGVDGRADVFAMGCVLFHCLTGRAPFASEEIHAALLRVVLDDAPRVSDLRDDIPPALDDLIAGMLAKLPSDRPKDGAAVAEALGRVGGIGETRAAPAGARSISLTARERRVACVVLVRPGGTVPPEPEANPTARRAAPTMQMIGRTPEGKSVREAVQRHQGSVEHLPGGLLLVSVAPVGAATDQAARAARCALAVRNELPDAAIALVAGRGAHVGGRLPMGEAIDRGMELLAMAAPQTTRLPLRLDAVMAGLLDARFDVGGDASGLFLRGERDLVEPARTLLGRPTPCVGREHELTILESVLAQCVSEPSARAVLVTGPPGFGKSRVRLEMIRRVTRRVPQERPRASELGAVVQVWIAQGDPMSAGSPFGMIAELLRREAGLREGEPADVQERKLRARLARHLRGRDLARITEFLADVTGVALSGEPSVARRAADLDPMLKGDQIRQAFEDLLVAESEAAPILIVLEDLHWGDLPSVKTIDAALEALPDRPILVLALGRPEVHDLFPKLWEARGVQEIRLRELGKKPSAELVREVLGSTTPAALVDRITERAAGNAFYLEELIRAAASRPAGELASDAIDALPESVLAMVQARLEGLSLEARRLLRAGSVFGKVFWLDGVRALLGGEGAAGLDVAVAELTQGELLARRGEGRFPNEYRFRHALVRDAAYAMLTEQDLALGHRLAAGWLERNGERDAAALAQHFERGGEPARAVVWYRRAAEQALQGNDFEAAIDRARRGARHAEGELLAALAMIELEAHKWVGDATLAEAAGTSAMRAAVRGSGLWFAAAGETASMRVRLAKNDELAGLAAQILELDLTALLARATAASTSGSASDPEKASRGDEPRTPPTPISGWGAAHLFARPGQAVVGALARAAASLLHAGLHASAEKIIAAIDAVAKPVAERDYAVAARLYALHASRSLCYGDPASSLHYTELSIPAFLLTGDVRNACLVRVNAAHACAQLGSFPRAERALRSALAEAERLKLSNVAALAKQNLGPVLAATGELDEAERFAREAALALEKLSNRRQAGRSRVYLARILLAQRDATRALEEAERALAALEFVPPLHVLALSAVAEVKLASRDEKGALEAAERGMSELAALDGVEEGESRLRLVHAEALLVSGDRERARLAVGAAMDRLLSRAGRIQDSAARRSFCERVDENARIIQLARALLGGP